MNRFKLMNAKLLEVAERLWMVVANVDNGNWKQSPDWIKAAEEARDALFEEKRNRGRKEEYQIVWLAPDGTECWGATLYPTRKAAEEAAELRKGKHAAPVPGGKYKIIVYEK